MYVNKKEIYMWHKATKPLCIKRDNGLHIEIWNSGRLILPSSTVLFIFADEARQEQIRSLRRRERLAANALVATVLGSIPASVGTVESEGRQMKQYWI